MRQSDGSLPSPSVDVAACYGAGAVFIAVLLNPVVMRREAAGP